MINRLFILTQLCVLVSITNSVEVLCHTFPASTPDIAIYSNRVERGNSCEIMFLDSYSQISISALSLGEATAPINRIQCSRRNETEYSYLFCRCRKNNCNSMDSLLNLFKTRPAYQDWYKRLKVYKRTYTSYIQEFEKTYIELGMYVLIPISFISIIYVFYIIGRVGDMYNRLKSSF